MIDMSLPRAGKIMDTSAACFHYNLLLWIVCSRLNAIHVAPKERALPWRFVPTRLFTEDAGHDAMRDTWYEVFRLDNYFEGWGTERLRDSRIRRIQGLDQNDRR